MRGVNWGWRLAITLMARATLWSKVLPEIRCELTTWRSSFCGSPLAAGGIRSFSSWRMAFCCSYCIRGPPFFGGQRISGFSWWAKARALWFGRPSGGAKLGRGLNRMTREIDYCLRPIGVVRSVLKERSGAPRQGYEGAPDVWIEMI